jgi:hypothetical protein
MSMEIMERNGGNAALLAGFESSENRKMDTREVGAVAASAREEAEIKAAIFLARQFPRDEAAAYTKIIRSCQRPRLAEDATYQFPRGGKKVTGPSVQLAREIARCWGNIRTGLRIVSVTADMVHIRGYAYDLETNTYIEHEDEFAKLIQRKDEIGTTRWVPPDERDLRELINRRGAILVRNAILQVVPSDVVEGAEAEARNTVVKAAKGEIAQNREDSIRRLALAFDGLGVTTDMLAGYLDHPLSDVTPEEIADLRGVYKSISDGNSKREDYFHNNRAKVQTEENAVLNARLKGGKQDSGTQQVLV